MKNKKKSKVVSSTANHLSVRRVPDPKNDKQKKSFLILKYARETAESLLQTFKKVRAGKSRGATTDEEQDLLRAMLVFAGAGLDSLLKQIVRDALPEVLKVSREAQEELRKYVKRALRGKANDIMSDGSADGGWMETDHGFLADIVIAASPRDAVIKHLVNALIEESLQSMEQIFKVARCLGLDANTLGLTKQKEELRKIFDARNQIIHEMDIDFKQPRRNRFTRKQKEMQQYAARLLELGGTILSQVDTQLSA